MEFGTGDIVGNGFASPPYRLSIAVHSPAFSPAFIAPHPATNTNAMPPITMATNGSIVPPGLFVPTPLVAFSIAVSVVCPENQDSVTDKPG